MLNPMTRHAAGKERRRPETAPARQRPIEFQTDNGFSLIRLCDVDKSVSQAGTKHTFIVRDPDGYELDVTVEITNEVVAEVMWRCKGLISLESSYWINCAERHLADYLWMHEDYPPDASLGVDQLSLDDLDAARRWNCDGEKE